MAAKRMSDSWPSSAVNEIQMLNRRIEGLEKTVRNAFETINELHGTKEEVITNAQVKSHFGKLYRAIELWVEDVEQYLEENTEDFQKFFADILYNEKRDRVLQHLGLREDATGGWDPEDRSKLWLYKQEHSMLLLLSRLIWCRLNEYIFASEYPVGLDDTVTAGLDYIVQAIANDGDAGKESNLQARKWRSQAMKSLVATKSFQKDKESRLPGGDWKVFCSFFDKLIRHPFHLDSETCNKYFKTFQERVLGPATELKQFMACSSDGYYFTVPKLPERAVAEDRFYDFTLRDIARWKDLDRWKGFDGDFFCCLFPGVSQAGTATESKPDFLLVNPVIAVLDNSGVKLLQRIKQRQQLSSPDETDTPCFSSPSPISPPSSTARLFGESTNSNTSSPRNSDTTYSTVRTPRGYDAMRRYELQKEIKYSQRAKH